MVDSSTRDDVDISRPESEQQVTIQEQPDVLVVQDLTKIYDDGTLAVDSIDFNVKAGDFCVLIGPSGCGKSTTLHSIIGKVETTEGRILLNGTDITRSPTYQRDISLVFQDFQLFPHLSVGENIRYGLERMGTDKETEDKKIDDVLRLMQLADVRDDSPEALSAGQKQRVALARSLVLEPQLLLLDEPLGDLDYKMQKRMERELLRIHRELDTTFVYVTHDQSQAMRLADQIIVMNDGNIEQSGSVSMIYNQPSTAFVAAFVGDSNIFTGEIISVNEGDQSASVETDYGMFQVNARTAHSDLSDLVGREVPFVVRPQALRLDSTLPNTVTCSVKDVIHRPGRGTQLLLEMANEDAPKKELQFKSSERLTIERDTVTVGWNMEDSILLEQTSVVPDIDLHTDILGE
ncbi:ABC transporter ATP-binding protein [Haladaptatus halobius]|uniref:ABC transporter ATP-binding protein n=1 Tax=Haladaptatus halobius TaxID=2884875 RepID=UPI001D0BE379|nr:ABC transporter ATP-binding protein [Haladaptatus halobius]